MGMILRIASSRIVGQGDIVGRSGYFSLNLSANSVMRGRLDARRTLKSLVADLRQIKKYSFLYSLSCRFSLPAARPFIWLFDYLSSPIFGLFYIVITQSALFPFDFGIELLEQCYTVSY